MRLNVWAALALLVVGRWAWGATYYVDFAEGEDARAGTSEATAWKHAPGDANATGAAQARHLAPGDVVLL